MVTCSVWKRAQLVLHSVRPQTCVEQPLVAVVLVSALKPVETYYIAACQLGMTLDPHNTSTEANRRPRIAMLA